MPLMIQLRISTVCDHYKKICLVKGFALLFAVSTVAAVAILEIF